MPACRRIATLLVVALLVAAGADAQAPPSIVLELRPPNPDFEGAFGFEVAGVGDVNGDQTPDFLALDHDDDNLAYIFSGADGAPLHTIQPPGTTYFRAAAGVGDVDGDAVPDLLLGAPPEAHVFSGSSGELLYTIAVPDANDDFGYDVDGLGDVDGDGVPDLLIGDPPELFTISDRPGVAHVFSGADGAPVYALPSPSLNDGFGRTVAGLADLDGDAVPDLLVGARYKNVGGAHSAGRAHVYSGADGNLIRTLDPPHPREQGDFGAAVADAGDVDGDGVTDLAIGGPGEGLDNGGRAHVFSGAGGQHLYTLVPPYGPCVTHSIGFCFGYQVAGGAFAFSGADGAYLYALPGPDMEAFSGYGISLAGVGELSVSGEAARGLLIGAPDDGPGEEGRAYLWAFPLVVAAEPLPMPAAAVRVAPNPFRERATFTFTLAEAAAATFSVHDVLGREVIRLVDRRLSAGSHTVPVDARGWAAGTYTFRLAAGEHLETGRLTRLR